MRYSPFIYHLQANNAPQTFLFNLNKTSTLARNILITNFPNLYTLQFIKQNFLLTRLHSSRMHTVCLLTVSPSMHCAGGVCSGGCLVQGGIPACTEVDPPTMNRMTDRCKNITFPQTFFAGGNKSGM